MIFMVDTGTEHSVVNKPVAPLTEHRATIVRAIGTHTTQQFCQSWTCQLGGHMVTHKLLYLPECQIPLLRRDLLTKLGAQITFIQGGPTSFMVREPNALIMAVTMPTEGEWQLYCQEKGICQSPPACWRSFLMSGLKKGLPAWLTTMCP
jgi:hypothetical protein